MAANYTLNIEAGATFTRAFEYTNADGTVYPLTGYTAKLQIRETPEASLAALSVTPSINVATGTITVTLTAAQTSTLLLPKYVYAMELAGPGGEPVIRLVEGSVKVSPEVVRD